jgi:hypothetical protein
MTALAREPTALAPPFVRSRRDARTTTVLRLVPTDDGWSLVGGDGTAVFQAPGLRGRRRCLLFAKAHDVLTVLT